MAEPRIPPPSLDLKSTTTFVSSTFNNGTFDVDDSSWRAGRDVANAHGDYEDLQLWHSFPCITPFCMSVLSTRIDGAQRASRSRLSFLAVRRRDGSNAVNRSRLCRSPTFLPTPLCSRLHMPPRPLRSLVMPIANSPRHTAFDAKALPLTLVSLAWHIHVPTKERGRA